MEQLTHTAKRVRGGTLLLIIALLIVAYLVLPFVVQSFFTVPAVDDYENNNPARWAGLNPIITALKRTLRLYRNWQGTYTGFFGYLLMPFHYGGLDGVHIALFFITLLFVASLYWFVRCALNLIVTCASTRTQALTTKLLIFSGIFAVMTLASDSSDAFTWLAAAWVYTIPLAFVFLGGGLLCKASSENKTFYAVLSGILFFLASGGSLPVTSLSCLISFAGVILALGTKTSVKYALIAFLPALAGALFNAAAPGYTDRYAVATQAVSTLTYDFVGAAVTSAGILLARLQFLLEQTPAPVLFLILLFVSNGWSFSDRMKRACTPAMLICLLVCFPVLVLVPFPVILGSDGYMPTRAYMSLNCAITLWLATLAIWLGCWLQKRVSLEFCHKERLLAVILCMGMFFACGGMGKIMKAQQTIILSQMATGQYAAFFSDRKSVLEEIATSPEDDVVVVQRVPALSYVHDLGLSEDPASMDNAVIAKFYGKNSVIGLWNFD